LALRGLAHGAADVIGIHAISTGVEAVSNFLNKQFVDHSQKVGEALKTANERAWQALELSLAGDSWWERVKGSLRTAEDRSFRDQVQAFLQIAPIGEKTSTQFRQDCLRELRAARTAKLLTGGKMSPRELARQAGQLAGFDNPEQLLLAEHKALEGMGRELDQAGYPNLARFITLTPAEGSPLLVIAVRYIFRRQIETDAELFQGLAFGKLEKLEQGQEAGFANLALALEQQGGRLEKLLGDVQVVVVATHSAV